ncbi:hypothetical protein JCGZ_11203 [Jatropha curcas]|uniref:Uncharacterized protein n=1 Tax=Jatropha curcas TaxID=180498 RepID=A0A067KFX8_JATCU|nr:hypothetical protein JCGZ_11203 [Jatropha curcas]
MKVDKGDEDDDEGEDGEAPKPDEDGMELLPSTLDDSSMVQETPNYNFLDKSGRYEAELADAIINSLAKGVSKY